ncbi:MAG: HD family hydrolase [Myxococcales bacterium]|nr:HD family hydrolase [Myxococcales bacterium]
MTPDLLIDTCIKLDPLSELPRTGWLLRGIRPCESLADHSFGVAVVSALLVDGLRATGEAVDGERVLRLALSHDAPEARTGDIPMPSKTPELDVELSKLEASLFRSLLPTSWHQLHTELERAETLEARIVRAADKLQMMIKVLVYESQHRGRLEEFWQNPKNFRDYDIQLARACFDRVCERSGNPKPR